MKRNGWTHKFLALWSALLMALLLSGGAQNARAQQQSNPQPAILGASSTSNQVVVFPDPGNTPANQNLVLNLPDRARPQGVAFYGSDNALISDLNNSRIFVVQVSTATLLATIDTSTAGYNGSGTIAVAPDGNTALASGRSNTLYVVRGPFNAGSTIDQVTLPGVIAAFQTQAIVFNNAGRAFVYTDTGISVLDAPYNAVAFTIPVSNGSNGAIAIAPDGNTLLATDSNSNQVGIFKAPFSAASTPTLLTIPNGSRLDGIKVSPDGSKAIVVSAGAYQAAAISAPFSSSSTVEDLPLPQNDGSGFEDVDISPDGKLALLTGNAINAGDLLVLIRAPFTAAGATSQTIPIQNVDNPGRGTGSVRFQPAAAAPSLTISKSAPATVASGANLTYTISYANSGTVNATNAVIRDPLPTGTSFVSATNNGALMNGSVTFNVGNLPANSGNKTVSFTVNVTAAQGATITNSGYTIQADGASAVTGAPVSTTVTAAPAVDRVTGQGTIIVRGRRYNFNVDVTGNANGSASGSVVASNGRNDMVRSTQVTGLTIRGNTATITGTAVRKRKRYRFTLFVSDTRTSSGTFNVRSSGGNANGRVSSGFLFVDPANGGGGED